jgi:hypothetical protein
MDDGLITLGEPMCQKATKINKLVRKTLILQIMLEN